MLLEMTDAEGILGAVAAKYLGGDGKRLAQEARISSMTRGGRKGPFAKPTPPPTPPGRRQGKGTGGGIGAHTKGRELNKAD